MGSVGGQRGRQQETEGQRFPGARCWGVRISAVESQPNQGVEPTASSLRSGPVAERGAFGHVRSIGQLSED
jgi:hypothetical protein